MSEFDTALHDIFQGRETVFSGTLRELLRQLYERGGKDAGGLRSPGTEIGRFENLCTGTCFSNGYLRSRGEYRVVTGVNRDPRGRVESVTTQLVNSTDGTILQQHDIFDRGKFQRYSPYTHD